MDIWLGSLPDLELFVVLQPPAGDVNTSCEPNPALSHRILDELAEGRRSPGLAHEARMNADRHHLGITSLPLPPQLIESSPAAIEEVGGTAVALGEDEPDVVVWKGVVGD